MLLSIRALAVDLFIVVSNNIKVVYTEFVLIRSKHLCYYNIIRFTGYPSIANNDLLTLNSVVFKRTKSKTRPNKLYIKSCIHRSPNNSLLKSRRRRGGGPEKVSFSRHISYGYRLLVFWTKRKNISNLAVIQY
jgi:hypothetical protein